MKQQIYSRGASVFLCAASFLLLSAARSTAAAEAVSVVTPSVPAAAVPTAAVPAAEIRLSTHPFRIVHPGEGQVLPCVKSSFVFGSADPAGKLAINGRPVPVHPGGGFLTMVEYSSGTFAIKAELVLPSTTYSLTRTVFVAPPPGPVPASPLSIVSVQPEADAVLRPGDAISVECRGSPGAEAFFRIKGDRKKHPMTETSAGSGLYRGGRRVIAGDDFDKATIEITLENRKAKERVSGTAKGRMSMLDETASQVVEVAAAIAVIRSGSAFSAYDKAGYMLFPAKGTRLLVTGRKGSEFRVALNRSREGWISESEVTPLPEGTPEPAATAGNIVVQRREGGAVVRLSLKDRVPFEVTASPDRRVIDIVFFGAVSNTDWIVYESTDSLVEQVQWFQDDAGTYRMRVLARTGSWWGYDARFENGGFVFELRRPSLPAKGLPLAGVTVAVDAGHSPDTGAVGPTGLMEKDANRDIAAALEKKLLEKGARVVMLRRGEEGVALYERPRRARAAGADILVSIHGNALPEGGNPLEKNGYGVYYFYPHSFALAREISGAFSKTFGGGIPEFRLRNDGLYYGNLALVRVFQMPAVLVECAYVIVPGEEAMLRDARFHELCARSLCAGLERYVASMK